MSYFFASVITLLFVFLAGAGFWANICYISQGRYDKVHPWVDGILYAYILAYFCFIYKG